MSPARRRAAAWTAGRLQSVEDHNANKTGIHTAPETARADGSRSQRLAAQHVLGPIRRALQMGPTPTHDRSDPTPIPNWAAIRFTVP